MRLTSTHAQANHTGNVLENQLAMLLGSKGYTEHSTKATDAMLLLRPTFVRQYRRFLTLYGAKMRLDFFIVHPERWPQGLAMECKWQQVSGSVDEKFPYVVLNLSRLPCPAVICLAGGGYSAGARNWLLAQTTKGLTVLEGLDAVVRWGHRFL